MTRPGDEGSNELSVVVPDDARDLAADIADYQRELRARRRGQRLARIWQTRRWRQYGVSGPLITAFLLCVAGVGALLVLVRPDAGPTPRTHAPLATPPRPVGAIGGLLPATTLGLDGSARPARELRPALLVLVPADCACGPVLDALAGEASTHALEMVVVTTTPGTDAALLRGVHSGNPSVATDPEGVLTSTYDARGVTAVLVHQDGVVVGVVHEVDDTTQLGSALAALTTPRG